ncbi:hypothetical protein ACTL6U_21150 [Rhodovibrionaceae bacterium A322]
MTLPPADSLFIKAPDEAAAKAAASQLAAHGVALLDGQAGWILHGPNHRLLVGVRVVAKRAVLDAEGEVTAEAELEPGWFANLRLRQGKWNVAALSALVAPLGVELKHPKTPAQGWQVGTEKVTL